MVPGPGAASAVEEAEAACGSVAGTAEAARPMSHWRSNHRNDGGDGGGSDGGGCGGGNGGNAGGSGDRNCGGSSKPRWTGGR